MANLPILSRRQFLAASGAGFLHRGLSPLCPAAETSDYARRVLAKKPCGYWRLGEKSGAVVTDASGRGHDGSIHGPVMPNEKGILTRDPDTAMKFPGSQSYVEIPDSPDFSQPTSGAGLTVEAWIRPDLLDFTGESDDNYIHWMGKGVVGRHEWAFRFYPQKSSRPNRISAYLFHPGPGLGAGAYVQEPLSLGRWIHVVAAFEPGDKTNPRAGVSLYKDGRLAMSPAISKGALYKSYDITPAHGDAPLRLGTRDLKSFFTGALDEVAIYPRVLTAGEVADNYRAGKAG